MTDHGQALAVEHVDVAYRVRGRELLALRDVSFAIDRGESYGLVGESGSGKSTMALAVVRYLARNGRVSRGGRLRGRLSRAVCSHGAAGRGLRPVGRALAEVPADRGG